MPFNIAELILLFTLKNAASSLQVIPTVKNSTLSDLVSWISKFNGIYNSIIN